MKIALRTYRHPSKYTDFVVRVIIFLFPALKPAVAKFHHLKNNLMLQKIQVFE
jgi:hypothetical protein